MNTHWRLFRWAALLGLMASVDPAEAQTVALQNGTGTFSQTAGKLLSPDQVVDGDFGDYNGWAIFEDGPSYAQTAVWETGSDLSAGTLTFALHFLHYNPRHLLGRFRFSVTTDNRNQFADGLHTGGDVSANWTVLSNPLVEGPDGMTFAVLPDHSVLAGGTTANQGIYTVRYSAALAGVTGIRLEAMEDPSLPPGFGPGLATNNENFLLTEMVVTAGDAPVGEAVPEPTSWLLMFPSLALLSTTFRRRKRS